ncbi:MAG: PQQ-binding-like beta-propeller repeat protein [Pseudomonadota bacterium]
MRLSISAGLVATSLAVTGCALGGGKDNAEEVVVGDRISVLSLEQDLIIDRALAAQPAQLPPVFINDAWPQPGGYSHHAMQHLSLEPNFRVLWKSDAGAGSNDRRHISASPVVAWGSVFTLDAKAVASAFDAKTGRRLWRRDFSLKGESADAGYGGGVAVSGGNVIVTTGFGDVIAVDAESGEEIWKRSLGVPVRTPPTAAGGQIYVTTVENHFYAMDDRTGTTLWSYRGISETASLVSDATPAVMGDLVVAPFSSGELVAFQAQNGRELWSDFLSRTGRVTPLAGINAISGRPVINRGRVVAVSHNGRLVSIDLRSGRRFWSHNLTSIETPWVAGDHVFLVTTNSQVVALNWDDGRIRWVSDLPSFKNEKKRKGPIRWAGPVLAGNQLILVSSEGRMVFLSPESGETIGDRKVPDGSFIAPVVADGVMYLLTSGGQLVAFGGGTGVSTTEAKATRTIDVEVVEDISLETSEDEKGRQALIDIDLFGR